MSYIHIQVTFVISVRCIVYRISSVLPNTYEGNAILCQLEPGTPLCATYPLV